MVNKWRIIVLGLVFSHGANLIAMDKKAESPKRAPLSCSAELRMKTAAITIAHGITVESKHQKNRHCGGSTPSEDNKHSMHNHPMRDAYPIDFQH